MDTDTNPSAQIEISPDSKASVPIVRPEINRLVVSGRGKLEIKHNRYFRCETGIKESTLQDKVATIVLRDPDEKNAPDPPQPPNFICTGISIKTSLAKGAVVQDFKTRIDCFGFVEEAPQEKEPKKLFLPNAVIRLNSVRTSEKCEVVLTAHSLEQSACIEARDFSVIEIYGAEVVTLKLVAYDDAIIIGDTLVDNVRVASRCDHLETSVFDKGEVAGFCVSKSLVANASGKGIINVTPGPLCVVSRTCSGQGSIVAEAEDENTGSSG